MDAGRAAEPTLHPAIFAPSMDSRSQLCCLPSTPATPCTSTRCARPARQHLHCPALMGLRKRRSPTEPHPAGEPGLPNRLEPLHVLRCKK